MKLFFQNNIENKLFGNICLSIQNKILKLTIFSIDAKLITYIKLSNNINISHFDYIFIPGRKLFDICKKLSGFKIIFFTILDQQLIINVKNIKFIINLVNIFKIYNFYKFYHKPIRLLVNNLKFIEFLLSIYFAVSTKQHTQYILNGTNMILKNNNLQAISGDGFRLALNTLIVNMKTNLHLSFILSKKTITDILTLLDFNKQNNILIYLNKDFIQIVFKKIYFITKLMIGHYPKLYFSSYKVLLKEYPYKSLINIASLQIAIQRIISLVNDKVKNITFIFKTNLLRIITNNQLNEQAEEYINIIFSAKENVIITINALYLLDILINIKNKFIIIYLKNSISSMILQNPNNLDNIHIIMPVNV